MHNESARDPLNGQKRRLGSAPFLGPTHGGGLIVPATVYFPARPRHFKIAPRLDAGSPLTARTYCNWDARCQVGSSQHAGNRPCGVGLATLIEKATSCQLLRHLTQWQSPTLGPTPAQPTGQRNNLGSCRWCLALYTVKPF